MRIRSRKSKIITKPQNIDLLSELLGFHISSDQQRKRIAKLNCLVVLKVNISLYGEERQGEEEDKTVWKQNTTETEVEQAELEACTESIKEDQSKGLFSNEGIVEAGTDKDWARERRRDKINKNLCFENVVFKVLAAKEEKEDIQMLSTCISRVIIGH